MGSFGLKFSLNTYLTRSKLSFCVRAFSCPFIVGIGLLTYSPTTYADFLNHGEDLPDEEGTFAYLASGNDWFAHGTLSITICNQILGCIALAGVPRDTRKDRHLISRIIFAIGTQERGNPMCRRWQPPRGTTEDPLKDADHWFCMEGLLFFHLVCSCQRHV